MARERGNRTVWPFDAVRRVTRRLKKRLSSAYYGHLCGRSVPGAALIGKLVVRQGQRDGRGDVPRSREVWETEYRAGQWDFLLELGQMSRHAVLAAYIHESRPGAQVLDVGCGSGKFFHTLRPFGYARFVGVDLSEAALEPLRPLQDAATRFVCANADTYVPEGTFDAIVFNESLYYFEDPLRTVERYGGALAPDGIVLVSTFESSTRALSILRALKERYPLLDEIRISHRRTSWTCSVFGRALDRVPAPEDAR